MYGLTFLITIVVFFGAWLATTFINNEKTAVLKNEEDTIATQILALQAKSDLLTANLLNAAPPLTAAAALCSSSTNTQASATTTAAAITASLNDLESKLSFMQSQIGPDNPDLFRLERYYSLMEIKDYNLEKVIAKRCPGSSGTTTPPLFILYFYPTGTCNQCVAENYILQAVKQQYRAAHVYSFDYNDDWAAVQSLITLPKIPATTTPPFLIVNGTVYPAFSNLSDMQTAIEKNLTAYHRP